MANRLNLLASNDSDNENIDVNIERMQTISIRKNNNNNNKLFVLNENKSRRKSAYQTLNHNNNNNYEEKNELNNWNYDELNELKLKFLSLLSSTHNNEISSSSSNEINRLSGIKQQRQEDFYQYSTRNSLYSQIISNDEHSKIESFYKSFGTQLHVTHNYASLYTMTLNDSNDSKTMLDTIINLFMLNDDSAILKQNWTVCHRGKFLLIFDSRRNHFLLSVHYQLK